MHISASLILNGVSVKWIGHVDLERLEGTARLEFDHQMAKVRRSSTKQVVGQLMHARSRQLLQAEDELLQRQVQFYTDRLKEFEERTQLKKGHF